MTFTVMKTEADYKYHKWRWRGGSQHVSLTCEWDMMWSRCVVSYCLYGRCWRSFPPLCRVTTAMRCSRRRSASASASAASSSLLLKPADQGCPMSLRRVLSGCGGINHDRSHGIIHAVDICGIQRGLFTRVKYFSINLEASVSPIPRLT